MQQLQQQLQAAAQEIQQLQAEIQSKKYQTDTKAQVDAEEIRSRERIAQMSNETKILETRMETAGEILVAKIKAGLDQMQTMLDQAHEDRMKTKEHAARHAEKAFDAAREDKTGAESAQREDQARQQERAHAVQDKAEDRLREDQARAADQQAQLQHKE